jgi:hypothetical protein
MAHMLSLESASHKSHQECDRGVPKIKSGCSRVVDFPGNPRMRPRVTMKMA